MRDGAVLAGHDEVLLEAEGLAQPFDRGRRVAVAQARDHRGARGRDLRGGLRRAAVRVLAGAARLALAAGLRDLAGMVPPRFLGFAWMRT